MCSSSSSVCYKGRVEPRQAAQSTTRGTTTPPPPPAAALGEIGTAPATHRVRCTHGMHRPRAMPATSNAHTRTKMHATAASQPAPHARMHATDPLRHACTQYIAPPDLRIRSHRTSEAPAARPARPRDASPAVAADTRRAPRQPLGRRARTVHQLSKLVRQPRQRHGHTPHVVVSALNAHPSSSSSSCVTRAALNRGQRRSHRTGQEAPVATRERFSKAPATHTNVRERMACTGNKPFRRP
jgi:hypothetical protein